jgi:hypothetical protein
VHNVGVKTRANINLDADVYDFASAYASAKGIPLGAAVSELLRRVQQIAEPPASVSPRLKTSPRGYLVRAKTGRVITAEVVKEAAEDDIA